MASVRKVTEKRSDTRYRAWALVAGKRHSTTLHADGKRHAEALAAAWEAELRGPNPGRRRPPNPITVGELVDRYLADRVELSPHTLRTYHSMRRYLGPLADQPAAKITPRDVMARERALIDTGLSPSTVHQFHCLLSGAWRWGLVQELVATSPVVAVRPPTVRRHPIVPPTTDTVRALIAATGDDRDPTARIGVLLAAATGARRAELCGLRWDDLVVLADGTVVLRVQRVIDARTGGGWATRRPKTVTSDRSVDIDTATADALEAHRAWQTGFRAVELDAGPHEWILGDVLDDGPWRPDRLSGAFERARARVPAAGKVRLHDLRHWSVTTLIAEGVAIPGVAARHGHSPATTMGVYAHQVREQSLRSAGIIGDALRPE
jgi:integrase